MIFVTVGTHDDPFDRLLTSIGDIGSTEEVVVQTGCSSIRPAGARCTDYMTIEELTAAIRRSRLVIMHAGVGSIMTSLANGKRPVVVPRRKNYGEHVDDHQLELARRLAEAELVTLVEDPSDLGAELKRVGERSGIAPGGRECHLAVELRNYLEATIAERRRKTGPRRQGAAPD